MRATEPYRCMFSLLDVSSLYRFRQDREEGGEMFLSHKKWQRVKILQQKINEKLGEINLIFYNPAPQHSQKMHLWLDY